MRRLSRVWLVIGTILPAAPLPAEEPPDVRAAEAIGSRLEVFFDDWLINRRQGVELALHPPRIRAVVLRFDAPWEGPASGYVTVFSDGERYRMYYRGCSGDPQGSEVTCYAESRDGVRWVKPDLGLFEYQGSKANNIVLMGEGAHNFAVFRDDNPAADEDARYKAVASGGFEGKAALFGYASSDGLRWRKISERPIITKGAFDSQNTAMWDAVRGCYVAFVRDFKDGIRHVRCATSPDFVEWSEPRFVSFGDAPAEHLYTNAIVAYHRAPQVYVGLPMRFLPERRFIAGHPHKGAADGVFMSARDPYQWDRRFMEAFIRPGPDRLNWTDRSNMPARGVLATGETELSIYWVEHYRAEDTRLRRGTVRTDGFVSVRAPYGGGEFTTRPILFEGDDLVLNYATSAAGSIRVEVLDDAGTAVPGYGMADAPELYGDEIARVYRWKGDASAGALAGRPIRLRFAMADADLYSIQFRASSAAK